MECGTADVGPPFDIAGQRGPEPFELASAHVLQAAPFGPPRRLAIEVDGNV